MNVIVRIALFVIKEAIPGIVICKNYGVILAYCVQDIKKVLAGELFPVCVRQGNFCIDTV